MRIGIAAASTPQWPKLDWVEAAARNIGHDVLRITSAKDLPSLIASSDMVILGHRNVAGRWPNIRDAIAARQCPVVYWCFDLIATEPGIPLVRQVLFERYREHFCGVDLAIVKERSLLPEYRAAGVNAVWCDQGCPSDIAPVEHVEKQWDMLVWGQGGGHYRERHRAVQVAVERGYRVAWADRTGCQIRGVESLPWTHPHELHWIAARACCVLSVGRRNDLDGYWSDGFWMALGMGCCVIRKWTPGLPDGPYLPFETDAELELQLNWVRANPGEAIKLGWRAREWVLSEHTLEHSVTNVIRLAAVHAAAADASV